jgi:hypothetical protein
MYYLSCTGWRVIDKKPEPSYHIKGTISKDGINWERPGRVVIDFKTDTEGGIASACLPFGHTNMWYCYRDMYDYRTDKRKSYRIGYAVNLPAPNGSCWKRMDNQVNLHPSESGWDSEMLAYPNIIEHQGVLYMFYNGNGFGKTGFGYATMRSQWR